MTFERFAVVRVPFPFSDPTATKNRPALVISNANAFNTPVGHSVMAMITSMSNPSWPLDCGVSDLKSAGLPAPSKVRFKLFTLDHRLIRGELGTLGPADRAAVTASLTTLLGGSDQKRDEG